MESWPIMTMTHDDAVLVQALVMARCPLSTVFRISMAMVMGPTPPGTGVMAPATAAHSS